MRKQKNNEQQKILEQNERSVKMQKELDRIYEDALTSLSSVIESKKVYSGNVSDENIFINVSKIVGEHSGVTINPIHSKDYIGAESIVEIAKDSNVRIRDVKLSGEWYKTDSGPLLAFYKDENFYVPVALIPKGPSKYICINPYKYEEFVVTKKEAESFFDTAYMYYKSFSDEKITIKSLLKFALVNIKRDFIVYLLLGIVCALVGLLIPEMTRVFTDSIIPQAASNQAYHMAVIVLICTIASSAFSMIRDIAMMRIQIRTTTSLQAAVVNRVINLPVRFFRNYSTGELTSRAMSITQIEQAVFGTLISSVMSVVFGIVYFFQLQRYSKDLTKWAVLFSIIPLLISAVFTYINYIEDKKIIDINGKITGKLLQFVNGINKLITTFSEKRAFVEWSKLFVKRKKSDIKILKAGTVNSAIMTIVPICISIAFYAIYMSMIKKNMAQGIQTQLTTGAFLAFMSAFSAFQSSIMGLGSTALSTINIIPLYQYVKPIMDAVPEVDDAKPSVKSLNGNIEVNHVNYRYEKDQELVLSDVSLSVHPGEFVAIVGNSGSGKSTLLRVLLGFEKPESGTVYYDDQDLSSVDVGSVRRRIGVVLQNSSVMQGSIFENICGSANLTQEDAWQAAKMAGLDKDIEEMPMGMFTLIPAGGSILSGGQRQRLIIAQALAKKPDIIFFDEATSALDNKTQAVVCESLDNLKITRVVVAHRLSTIINADTIYVLQNGKIVESGNYKTLMKNKKFFYQLASRQQV